MASDGVTWAAGSLGRGDSKCLKGPRVEVRPAWKKGRRQEVG